MPLESYCLDDVSFVGLFDKSASPRDDIRALLDAAAQILDDGNAILAPSNIDNTPVAEDFALLDVLYMPNFSETNVQYGLDRDIWLEFMTFRNRLEAIDVDAPLAASLFKIPELCVRVERESSSAAIICADHRDQERFALLQVGSNRPDTGNYEFRTNGGLCRAIYVMGRAGERSLYVRWLITERNVTEAELFSLWETAFPNLDRSDNLSFRRFRGTYAELRDDVVRHLSFLNDHFFNLWQQCKMDFPGVKAHAGSGWNIDLSNESAKTRNAKGKMKQRDADFSGRTIRCELHTKIRPNINRIHFHPPIKEVGSGKMLIGIFVDHLDT